MQIKGIHLEPTNKCTLKCPQCPRTDFIKKFGIKRWNNKDINLDHLIKFLDVDIENLLFNLCGHYGDPIYYNELYELLSWIKSNKGIVYLTTNGSYKDSDWWEKHLSLLDCRDKIIFSIDGLPDNFTQYRINGDWDSIYTGIKCAVKSQAKSIWKYIPFAFNEKDIDTARELSASFGIDEFIITPSYRWEENNWHNNNLLKPAEEKHLDNKTKKRIEWVQGNSKLEIDPRCYNGQEHFITAGGFYTPCAHSADWRFYYASGFHKNKENYDISKTTITKILNENQVFFDTLKDQKLKYCTFNCPKI